jgi:hypothetical protein
MMCPKCDDGTIVTQQAEPDVGISKVHYCDECDEVYSEYELDEIWHDL